MITREIYSLAMADSPLHNRDCAGRLIATLDAPVILIHTCGANT
jgi:hypothetical protein